MIKQASEILKKGGIVAFPTETVYGLGACFNDPRAVARIFEVKQRPFFDPLIVHISSMKDIEKLCYIPSSSFIKILTKKFWPGPLTLVLPKQKCVPDIVTSGLDSVAIRMPAHPLARKLIKRTGKPLAAPSANPFSYISPTTALQVKEQIGDKIDLILDGGPCSIGVESTVLDLTGSSPVLLRPGGVTQEELEPITGPLTLSAGPMNAPHSPGQLKKHYSPRTPLTLIHQDDILKHSDDPETGFLFFTRPKKIFRNSEILSPSGDLREAAANLFQALYKLDSSGLKHIFAEIVEEKGLGTAIMDRLRKAAAQGFRS